jgi:hypothetical protein
MTERGRLPPSRQPLAIRRTRHALTELTVRGAHGLVDAELLKNSVVALVRCARSAIFLLRQQIEQRLRLRRECDRRDSLFAVREQLIHGVVVVDLGPVMANECLREWRDLVAARTHEPLVAAQRVVAKEVLAVIARPPRLDDERHRAVKLTGLRHDIDARSDQLGAERELEQILMNGKRLLQHVAQPIDHSIFQARFGASAGHKRGIARGHERGPLVLAIALFLEHADGEVHSHQSSPSSAASDASGFVYIHFVSRS